MPEFERLEVLWIVSRDMFLSPAMWIEKKSPQKRWSSWYSALNAWFALAQNLRLQGQYFVVSSAWKWESIWSQHHSMGVNTSQKTGDWWQLVTLAKWPKCWCLTLALIKWGLIIIVCSLEGLEMFRFFISDWKWKILLCSLSIQLMNPQCLRALLLAFNTCSVCGGRGWWCCKV